jgi:hypothetical protein
MDDPSNKTKLCGVQGCCPIVEKNANGIVITDDENGRVTLTPQQWEDLRAKMAGGEL